MNFKLLIPQKTIIEADVSNAVVPGAEGYIGFLEGHIPYVTPLKTGVLEITGEQGQHVFAVCGGYCEISNQGLVVLAEYAQAKADIDLEEAQEELKEVEQIIAQAPEDEDISSFLLKKEWAEIRVELAQ